MGGVNIGSVIRARKLVVLIQTLCDFGLDILRKIHFAYCHFTSGIDSRSVVFDSYAGQSYTCNPRALYEQMLTDDAYKGFKFIWGFNNPGKYCYLSQNSNTTVVKRNSKAYVRACATSKYIINNINHFPSYITKNNGRILINTWHGKPFKRVGCDYLGSSIGYLSKETMGKQYSKSGRRLSYLFSPAPIFSEIMSSIYSLAGSGNEKAVIETGYPRNDYLFRYTQDDVLHVKTKFGLPLDKIVILYAPTWRPYERIGSGNFMYNSQLDLGNLYRQLGNDYVLLFRAHYKEAVSVDYSNLSEFIYDATKVEDVNELYIISDLMISDYSSVIFDFANTCKPMVFYMYDYEQYSQSAHGLYFPVDVLPGRVVYQEADLAPAIKEQIASFAHDEKYRRFNEAYNCLDGADCSGRALEKIFDLELMSTQLPANRKRRRNHCNESGGQSCVGS